MRTDTPIPFLLCFLCLSLAGIAPASQQGAGPVGGDKAKATEPDSDLAKLDRNIASNPNYPFAYVVRGSFKKSRGDLDGALADFNKAVSLNPANPSIWNQRGLVKQAKRDLPAAATDFTHALQLNPNYADAWYNRGRVRKASGDLDGALADYSRTLELDPHYADAYLRRGNVKKAKGDIEGALADFKLCYKYGDSYWKDYARINLWLTRTGKGEKAATSAVLVTYLQRRAPPAQGDWPAKIMAFLLDRLDEPSFLAAASAKTDNKEALCQALYYAGMKHLLTGDKAKAVDCFTKSRATQRWDCDEFQFATAELKALGKI